MSDAKEMTLADDVIGVGNGMSAASGGSSEGVFNTPLSLVPTEGTGSDVWTIATSMNKATSSMISSSKQDTTGSSGRALNVMLVYEINEMSDKDMRTVKK